MSTRAVLVLLLVTAGCRAEPQPKVFPDAGRDVAPIVGQSFSTEDVRDRTGEAEEVMRLGSHLELFEQIVRTESDAPGRKLEFVVQEMGRETNTIGSKANDVEISKQVVEIKATLDKVRELVQNVE